MLRELTVRELTTASANNTLSAMTELILIVLRRAERNRIVWALRELTSRLLKPPLIACSSLLFRVLRPKELGAFD
jgi:hypothetical protein